METSESAQYSIESLKALGVTQAEIARKVAVDPSYIPRLLNPDENPTFNASSELCVKLSQLVITVCQERLEKIVCYLPIYGLDTCNPGLAGVTDEVNEQLCRAIRSSLVTMINPESPPVPLPEGIDAAVASLGRGLYIIKLDPSLSLINQFLHIIHELRHEVQRLRAGRSDNNQEDTKNSEPDHFGRIL